MAFFPIFLFFYIFPHMEQVVYNYKLSLFSHFVFPFSCFITIVSWVEKNYSMTMKEVSYCGNKSYKLDGMVKAKGNSVMLFVTMQITSFFYRAFSIWTSIFFSISLHKLQNFSVLVKVCKIPSFWLADSEFLLHIIK